MLDAEPHPESFKQLPDEIQNQWRRYDPDTGKGYEKRLINVGFEIVYFAETGGHALEPGESGLPDIAIKYGITMHLRGFKIEARKPV